MPSDVPALPLAHLDTYDGALAWLYRQSRAGRPRHPQRMRNLITALGLSLPPKAIHVVGTVGKGTVTAMIAAAYQAAGWRTGSFLSPHVEDFRERVMVALELISEEAVRAFVQRVRGLELEPPPAFFELAFALALEHFAARGVEVAAVEAGIGAKNDATLVLENVRGVVITSVGRDHLETLGPTLRDIARDKAEAIRPGVPVVTGAAGEALEAITEVASQRQSPLFIDLPGSPLFQLPRELDEAREADPIRWQNQRLAAATLRLMGEVGEEALLHGLQSLRLPAREELFELAGRQLILDGAHNPSAARALRAMLPTPFVLIFGALPNKLGEETLAELEPYALQTFITQADERESKLEHKPGRTFIADPLEALEHALAHTPENVPIVIAGSLYLAGRVRPFLRARQQALQPFA